MCLNTPKRRAIDRRTMAVTREQQFVALIEGKYHRLNRICCAVDYQKRSFYMICLRHISFRIGNCPCWRMQVVGVVKFRYIPERQLRTPKSCQPISLVSRHVKACGTLALVCA